MEDIYLGDKGGRGRKVRRKKEFQLVQLCPTPWDSMDCSLPGSSVHGFLQARILEWVAMPCSRESSPPRDSIHVFCITARLFIHWATWEAPYRKTKMPKLTPYFSGLFPARGFQLYIPKWTQFSFSNLISISLMLSALFFFFSLSSPTLQIHCSLTFLFFQSCFSWNSLWLWWPHVLSCNPTFTVLPHSTDLEQCKGPHPMLFQAGRWGTEDCHYPTHSPTTIFLSGAEYNKL